MTNYILNKFPRRCYRYYLRRDSAIQSAILSLGDIFKRAIIRAYYFNRQCLRSIIADFEELLRNLFGNNDPAAVDRTSFR